MSTDHSCLGVTNFLTHSLTPRSLRKQEHKYAPPSYSTQPPSRIKTASSLYVLPSSIDWLTRRSGQKEYDRVYYFDRFEAGGGPPVVCPSDPWWSVVWKKKKEYMTPASRLVPHDSTDRARCGLVSMFGMGIDALHMRCTYSGRRGGYLVYIY